jgi:hypothetical protein
MNAFFPAVESEAVSGAELHPRLGDMALKHDQRRGRQATTTALFRTIPPERIGLQGEYDHQGLAKRVALAFRQNCSLAEIADLRVLQRGAVVLLVGSITNQRLLIKLVNLALSVSGTADVEINGVSVGFSLRQYLEVKPSQETLQKLQKLTGSSS